MLVKDLQGSNRLIQILGRLYFQESGALPKEFLIIRNNITRAHRCISLKKIADALLLRSTAQDFLQAFGKIQNRKKGIRMICHCGYLLLVGQALRLYCFQHCLQNRFNFFHGYCFHFLSFLFPCLTFSENSHPCIIFSVFAFLH